MSLKSALSFTNRVDIIWIRSRTAQRLTRRMSHRKAITQNSITNALTPTTMAIARLLGKRSPIVMW